MKTQKKGKKMQPLKFRCSSLGRLMTSSRGGGKALSATTKDYLLEVFIEENYGRTKIIENRYIEKGLYVEEDSIKLVSDFYDIYLHKNTKEYSNKWIKGTPDVISNETVIVFPDQPVIDVKSSWNIFTFAKSKLTKDYYWQLQGYMWLTKRKKAQLIYCLENAPEEMVFAEKERQMYKQKLVHMEGTPEFDAMEKMVEKNMIFDDIPAEERIKIIEVDWDSKTPELLKAKVEQARDYISNLSLNYGNKKNK